MDEADFIRSQEIVDRLVERGAHSDDLTKIWNAEMSLGENSDDTAFIKSHIQSVALDMMNEYRVRGATRCRACPVQFAKLADPRAHISKHLKDHWQGMHVRTDGTGEYKKCQNGCGWVKRRQDTCNCIPIVQGNEDVNEYRKYRVSAFYPRRTPFPTGPPPPMEE